MSRRLLLLSNSANFGKRYLEHAEAEIERLLGSIRRLLFVPFALHDQKTYYEKVRMHFLSRGIVVDRLLPDGSTAPADSNTMRYPGVESAEALFVGGGNTFRLLDGVQRAGAIEAIRRRVAESVPYIGASAGTVISAPTLQTTNDMPIVQPASFEALGLVPFQINCHYLDPDPASRHMGETREERIREFLEEKNNPVVGLREGSWLRVEGDRIELGGSAGARIFRSGSDPEELVPGADLSTLAA